MSPELDRIAAALERIALALETVSAGVVPIDEPDDVCLHPEDKRDDRSVMGRIDWTCKVCRFTHTESLR